MGRTSEWIVAGSACILMAFSATSSFGETPVFQRELLAARSVAILVRSVDPGAPDLSDFENSVRSRLADEIQKRKLFHVVDSPTEADLVCVYLLYAPRWVQQRKP